MTDQGKIDWPPRKRKYEDVDNKNALSLQEVMRPFKRVVVDRVGNQTVYRSEVSHNKKPVDKLLAKGKIDLKTLQIRQNYKVLKRPGQGQSVYDRFTDNMQHLRAKSIVSRRENKKTQPSIIQPKVIENINTKQQNNLTVIDSHSESSQLEQIDKHQYWASRIEQSAQLKRPKGPQSELVTYQDSKKILKIYGDNGGDYKTLNTELSHIIPKFIRRHITDLLIYSLQIVTQRVKEKGRKILDWQKEQRRLILKQLLKIRSSNRLLSESNVDLRNILMKLMHSYSHHDTVIGDSEIQFFYRQIQRFVRGSNKMTLNRKDKGSKKQKSDWNKKEEDSSQEIDASVLNFDARDPYSDAVNKHKLKGSEDQEKVQKQEVEPIECRKQQKQSESHQPKKRIRENSGQL